ncbi:hypothetical protein, partial [Sneathiella sp.]|uniref:hypothetical protein n=1 Tax=Sneathiella sp. TaxID=1964365 RepID=UPI0025FEA770
MGIQQIATIFFWIFGCRDNSSSENTFFYIGFWGRILLRCPWVCFAMSCIAGPAGEATLFVG